MGSFNRSFNQSFEKGLDRGAEMASREAEMRLKAKLDEEREIRSEERAEEKLRKNRKAKASIFTAGLPDGAKEKVDEFINNDGEVEDIPRVLESLAESTRTMSEIDKQQLELTQQKSEAFASQGQSRVISPEEQSRLNRFPVNNPLKAGDFASNSEDLIKKLKETAKDIELSTSAGRERLSFEKSSKLLDMNIDEKLETRAKEMEKDINEFTKQHEASLIERVFPILASKGTLSRGTGQKSIFTGLETISDEDAKMNKKVKEILTGNTRTEDGVKEALKKYGTDEVVIKALLNQTGMKESSIRELGDIKGKTLKETDIENKKRRLREAGL